MKELESPYFQTLKKSNINWQKWNPEIITKARESKKMIFLHTGRFSESIKRNKSIEMFENKEISSIINEHFIAVLIDKYSNSELYYTLLDLILIIEHKTSSYINVILLPDKELKPITAFSSLETDEVLKNLEHIKHLYNTQNEKLGLAGKYLSEKLRDSGVVTKREPPIELTDKILHLYVRNWSNRFTQEEFYRNRKPYTFNSRHFIFLIRYGEKYQIKGYREKIEESLLKAYYSPMFDPIEGGMFRQAWDSTLKEPLYELDLNENIQLMYLYSIGYKYYKNPIYKDVYTKIFLCIENRLKADNNCYINSISPLGNPSDCNYYKYSLTELKEVFKNEYKKIAKALGMDINANKSDYQIISNTPEFAFISDQQVAKLKEIRKTRTAELTYDSRSTIRYNTLLAGCLCQISKTDISSGFNEYYLYKAGLILDNVLDNKNLKIKNYSLHDYSLLINSLINYALCTRKEKYITKATEYVSYTIANFYQISTGVFTNTSRKTDTIMRRREGLTDYFKFSANSVMAKNMFLMYRYTGAQFYLDVYKQMLYNIEPQLAQSGPLMTSWANELLTYLNFKPLKNRKEANYLRNLKI